MPAEVHRGCVHPGKPYIALNLYFGTVCVLCLLLDRAFIHLCLENISEPTGSCDGSGGGKNLHLYVSNVLNVYAKEGQKLSEIRRL